MSRDLRQTPEYAKYMVFIGWKVVQLNKDYLYTRKVPLLGWVGKIQRPQEISTEQQIKALGLSVLYAEPSSHESQVASHFSRSRSTFLPPKTIQINLTESEERLFNRLKPKFRYNVRLAEKRGVTVKLSQNIESFSDMWQKSAQERGMWLSQKKEIKALWFAFKKTGNTDLIMAYKDNELLGGVLICYSPDAAFYMYAGSTQNGKKLFAPTILAWEAIKLSKKRKKKVFDFEGVYDSRYKSTKTWRGFTRFKEGFGGEVVEYPPTLVWYKNPLLRLLNL